MFRCDWCTKNIIGGEIGICLRRYRLEDAEGLCEDYFEDMSHELLFHTDCFLQNSEAELILHPFKPFGCSLCEREFDGLRRNQLVSLTLFIIGEDAQGEMRAFDYDFRDRTKEKNFCYDCLANRVDCTLLGIEALWAAFR